MRMARVGFRRFVTKTFIIHTLVYPSTNRAITVLLLCRRRFVSLYKALTFSCFIFGARFLACRFCSRSSQRLWRSGSSSAITFSFSILRFSSLLTAAASALAA